MAKNNYKIEERPLVTGEKPREKKRYIKDFISGKRIIEESQGFALKIKSDRVPLKFLLYSQHSEIKQNKFSTADILNFFKENPAYAVTTKGIGRQRRETALRSFMRGLPGNLSLVLNAIGLVEGSDDYYYELPHILFNAIKSGQLQFKESNDGKYFETIFTNISRMNRDVFNKYRHSICFAIKQFLDRKTQENKLRGYGKDWEIKALKSKGIKVKTKYFEQRKRYFETEKKEYIYIPYPTVLYEDMLSGHKEIHYQISKSLVFHPQCPNFVFRIFDTGLKCKTFYTVPFRILNEVLFKKYNPNKADIYNLNIKKLRNKNLLCYGSKKILDITGYEEYKTMESIEKAPYTAPYQRKLLEEYRNLRKIVIREDFNKRIRRLERGKLCTNEANTIAYIEDLNLIKALKVKEQKDKKTIFVVRIDSSYPDLLCIHLEDLLPEERFKKNINDLTVDDLFLIRNRILQNIEDFKNRLFEVEVEYDAFNFEAHERNIRDDANRCKFIFAWLSKFENDIYETEDKKIKIPIINIQKLWDNLIKDIPR